MGRSVPAPRGRLAAALVCACACAAAAIVLVPARAGADVFGPISLVSEGSVNGGPIQQAEYAHDSAISADGRYVAFDGSIGGVTGVWRRDLQTDAIEQVAGGDAAMPSISENGQYVSFTTNEGASLPEITHEQPDAHPQAEAVNVYRRDMEVEPAATAAEEAARPPQQRAFLAASVPSGSEEPLRYAGPGGRAPGESEGSYAAGRSAMSANGDKVAFVTAAVSNLVPYPALEEEERVRGETPVPHTPAGQVAVHSFDTGTTELVSRCRFECGQGAAAGAGEPVVAGEAESKPVGAASIGAAEFPKHGRDGSWPGASISADGSTVAWIAEDVAQQAPTLAEEHLEPIYEEPLWHRLPAAANLTRRVTGGSDPEAPGCAASGEVALAQESDNEEDPCQGPFVREGTGVSEGHGLIRVAFDDAPRLSADGEEVVFGANARTIAEKEDFDRAEGNPTDVFLVNMRPGLTRRQAITPLTQVGSPTSLAESAEVTGFEISPDGLQVAFTTIRTHFALGWPTLISSEFPEVGIGELYDADLADGTLTRVTHGYEGEGEQSQQPHRVYTENGDPYQAVGEPSELGALTPGFSGDGDELVFTSTAGNLVYGDGNEPAEPVSCCRPGDGSDVFAVSRVQFPSEPALQSTSPPPPVAIVPAWRLGATALSRPDGSILLYVRTPGAGAIRAGAQAAVVVVEPAGAARAAGHRSASRSRAQRAGARKAMSARGRQARAVGRARGRTKPTGAARTKPTGAARAVATRSVATSVAEAGEAGLTMLPLTLAPRYAALAREHGGLSATVTVTFTAPRQPTLRQSVAVTFLRLAKPPKARVKARGRSSKAGGRLSGTGGRR